MDMKEDQIEWFISFLTKSKGSGIKSMSNQQLADEPHKPTIRKFK